VKRELRRLHIAVERKTGVVFGRLIVDGHSPNGYPLRHLWLTVAPRRDGYAFAVTCKRHGVYVDYVPKHEEVSA
jgi:hypothetical protein